MRATDLVLALALLVPLAGLAGCTAPPGDRVLRLEVASPPRARQFTLDGSLQILRFTARGLLAEPRFGYVDWRAPGEQLQRADVRWDEVPSRTVERALAYYLRQSSPGLAVFDADSRAIADYWLSGRLDRFEQVIARDHVEVAVALDVTLIRTRDRALVLTGTYCARRPMSGEDPAASLPAFNAALQGVFASLVKDLGSGPAPGGRAGHGC